MRRKLCLAVLGALVAPAVHAQGMTLSELKALSVDQLQDIEVISVSKRSEPLARAPASIYVITNEAIHRAGVTTLPEALRLAPNLQVARIDASQYAISARGFNNAIGNKLLVLIDGRTVYTPLFSGVFWDQQELMLEDVERIEVISGPGATLWGANAVNGVINVITRSAHDTSGALFSAAVGDIETMGSFRYGMALGDDAALRVYGKYMKFGRGERPSRPDLDDDWERAQVGFRADWRRGADSFTLQGDAYDGESGHRGFAGPIEFTPVTVSGVNLLGRWQRDYSNGSQLQVQAYIDHTDRDDALFYRPEAEIYDLDAQYAFERGAHRVLWGGGYRRGHDDIEPGLATQFVPPSRTLSWGNLFVQDDIRLSEGVTATLGLKLEYNDYTDVEVLPTARLSWAMSENHLLWSALSRAVRAPARYDRDVRFPGSPPFLLVGGPNFKSEIADVVELGYRAQPSSALTFSVTGFVHFWDRVRSGTALPVEIENKIEGEIFGVEAWSEYRPRSWLLIAAGFNWQEEDLQLKPGSTDPVGVNNDTLRNDPDYVAMLRTRFDLPRDVEIDLNLRHVARLPAPVVPSYTELDARLGWRINRHFEISVVGRNLLHGTHPEYGDAFSRALVERTVLGQVRWAF